MAKFLVKIAWYVHITLSAEWLFINVFREILMFYIISSEINKTTASH